ncbi:MAG: hypothetical protein EB060_07165 [Proteobacteria bacterium]|nr:hypothetical protein [Pseudomonadota bacterium]
MKTLLLITAAVLTLATGPVYAGQCSTGHHKITKEEILAAQKAWGDGIVTIGKAEDHEKAAINHINKFYAYDLGPVLFKPTKASQVQFRDTKEEALSYFVGGKEPEDKGFALAPYTKVRFENHGIAIDCDSALAQGNYYFTKTDGQEIKVEYSFGYVEDKEGRLKINLHHSSLPYKPE